MRASIIAHRKPLFFRYIGRLYRHASLARYIRHAGAISREIIGAWRRNIYAASLAGRRDGEIA